MTRNAKPGETCVNCGQVVRNHVVQESDIAGKSEPIHIATCNCEGIDGPQIAD